MRAYLPCFCSLASDRLNLHSWDTIDTPMLTLDKTDYMAQGGKSSHNKFQTSCRGFSPRLQPLPQPQVSKSSCLWGVIAPAEQVSHNYDVPASRRGVPARWEVWVNTKVSHLFRCGYSNTWGPNTIRIVIEERARASSWGILVMTDHCGALTTSRWFVAQQLLICRISRIFYRSVAAVLGEKLYCII